MEGGDNWVNATYLYVVYKDTSATPPVIYHSKTSKSLSTTSGGAFSVLVSDVTATNEAKTYTPLRVWASNYTYGIAVACVNQTDANTYNLPIWNFLNDTTTATGSGLHYTEVTTNAGGATASDGWMLTTGYTLAGTFKASTSDVYAHLFGTFYGNGTTNSTAVNLGSIQGPVSYYEDVNGTMWIGWTDVDKDNSMTYAGYLTKLQGQLSGLGANALSTILAFVALFLVSLFAF